MKALIVDDSSTMRKILGRILRTLRFDCLEAADADEALRQLAEASDIRLVLVDWNMPRTSGLELIRMIRADEANASLRLVMVTTETEASRVADAIEAGANEYLMKPFTPEMLTDKLRTIGLEPPLG